MRSRVKIKAWKGGRSERIYARTTKEVKAKLLARVKAEGYKSFGDWLEAQAMAQQWGSLAFQQSVYLTAFGVGMRPVNSLPGNIQAEVSPATIGGR